MNINNFLIKMLINCLKSSFIKDPLYLYLCIYGNVKFFSKPTQLHRRLGLYQTRAEHKRKL